MVAPALWFPRPLAVATFFFETSLTPNIPYASHDHILFSCHCGFYRYLGVGLMHIPCYGIFALILRLKRLLLSRSFPDSYQSIGQGKSLVWIRCSTIFNYSRDVVDQALQYPPPWPLHVIWILSFWAIHMKKRSFMLYTTSELLSIEVIVLHMGQLWERNRFTKSWLVGERYGCDCVHQ